jgi:hypothetical protein
MKAIFCAVGLLALLLTPCLAKPDQSVDVIGKWYRVVPDCSLFLEFFADGHCTVECRWFDGRTDHSISQSAKWKFDGWCLALDPVDDPHAEHVVEFPLRLSLIELKNGERVLGLSLRWDVHKENIQADVFHRGDWKFTPPTTPDRPLQQAPSSKQNDSLSSSNQPNQQPEPTRFARGSS